MSSRCFSRFFQPLKFYLVLLLFIALIGLVFVKNRLVLRADQSDSITHVIGILFSDQFWNKQSLLDETHLGVIRVGLKPSRFRNYVRDPARFDWTPIDRVIFQNANKTIMVTISPTESHARARKTAVPERMKDLDGFTDFVAAIAKRYSDAIEYWQLGNEIISPKGWWANRYADYAKLLAAFSDTVRSLEPKARIVVAGFPTGSINTTRPKDLLRAISEGAAGKAQVVDLHYHKSWMEGGDIAQSIADLRNVLSTLPALGGMEIVVSENSTWFDKPAGLPAQTAYQQAIFATESIYAALGAGATFCVFGTLMDRPLWRGVPKLHRFNLNGLFHNPEKSYSDGRQSGPKPVTFTIRLIAELTKGLAPGDIKRVSSGVPNVVKIDVKGKRNYSVLWWSGQGKSIEVKVPLANNVKEIMVTEAVPKTASTWPPRDPFAGFSSINIPARSGMANVQLKPHMPVFLLP